MAWRPARPWLPRLGRCCGGSQRAATAALRARRSRAAGLARGVGSAEAKADDSRGHRSVYSGLPTKRSTRAGQSPRANVDRSNAGQSAKDVIFARHRVSQLQMSDRDVARGHVRIADISRWSSSESRKESHHRSCRLDGREKGGRRSGDCRHLRRRRGKAAAQDRSDVAWGPPLRDGRPRAKSWTRAAEVLGAGSPSLGGAAPRRGGSGAGLAES